MTMRTMNLNFNMHYYQHHIGDYKAATIHLNNDQDLAYRRLLEMYYDTEQPIPNDISYLIRRLRIDGQSIKCVLDDFFTLEEDKWHHARCDRELESYSIFRARQKANGSKGGRPNKPTGLPVETQAQPKKTLTTNHKPITNINTTPDGVSDVVWSDFLQLRKTKKSPLTQTALQSIVREAKKSGWTLDAALQECCTRGWLSFKAEWVQQKTNIDEQNRRRLL